MTIDEIKDRQSQLHKEIGTLLNRNRWYGKDKKRYWELVKEFQDLQKELDKLEGKTYDSDKWITKYSAESYVSLKDARLKLIDKIKDLHGVVLGKSDTGVINVCVYTETKIYDYTIHAHYRVEKIPETKRIVKDLCGNDVEEYDYRQVYVATIDNNGRHWFWRYK